MAKDLKPGIPQMPNAPDLSLPTAEEMAAAEERKQAAYAGSERVAEARRIVAEEESRLANRSGSIEEARGGGRGAYTNDEWDRAAQRTDPERRRRMQEVFDDSVLPNL